MALDNKSGFSSFMKAYEGRKEAGADGEELISGSKSREADGSFSFAGFQAFVSKTQDSVRNSELGSTVSQWLPDSLSNSNGKIEDLESGNVSNAADGAWSELSRTDRFKSFIVFLFLSVFFFFLSSIFFPMVLVMPQKFVFTFTLGSMFFMTAFAMVQGPSEFVKGLFTKERLMFTSAYMLSIVGTLYTCLFWKKYIPILFFSWMQVISLGWYAATYLPGGRTGVMFIQRFVRGIFSKGCIPLCKMVFACFQKLFN